MTTPPTRPAPSHDLPTVAAIAVIAYALASLLHEALGHGGGCLLSGGTPVELSSMHFRCDVAGAAPHRLLAGGGTVVQLVIGPLLYLAYHSLCSRGSVARRPTLAYALWLCAALNIMQGLGYLLFSGVGGTGDLAVVTAGLRPALAWRVAMAGVGAVLYWLATAGIFRALVPLLGATLAERMHAARRLALVPYAVGAALGLAAGSRNPGGASLLLLSGLAATLGGTSGLAWGTQTLRRVGEGSDAEPTAIIPRSWPVILIAAITSVAFVVVLGPGYHFR